MGENEKRAVFITGASAGIGAAAVEAFAAAGWHVVAGARRKERLETLAVSVTARHPEVRVLPTVCDVNKDDDVNAAVQFARENFGRLDCLVNNAGYGTYGTVEQTELEAFRANMETNYFGVLRCTKTALPLLRETAKRRPKGRWGASVIMISSFVGRRALPAMSAYCATKFALEGLSESLRIELYDDRISVSVVNPGVTQTEFFMEAQGRRPKGYPHPQAGMTAEEVADVILAATKRPFRNRYLTGWGKLGLLVQWAAPRVFDFGAAKTWKG
jgi:short-subunit dehydrogenase